MAYQRDMFDQQMDIMDQLHDQRSPLHAGQPKPQHIHSFSDLTGDRFLWNTQDGTWDMDTEVDTTHPRYHATEDNLPAAREALDLLLSPDSLELVDAE